MIDHLSPSSLKIGLCQCGCGNSTWVATQNNTRYGWVKGEPTKYCHGHWARTNLAKATRRIGGHSGSEHPQWKGGITIHSGYVMRKSSSHPRTKSNGYVFEHILVAETKIGRPISRDEIVHHLNGIKDDNRPDNLVVIPRNKHSSNTLRQLMSERIITLENLLKQKGVA